MAHVEVSEALLASTVHAQVCGISVLRRDEGTAMDEADGVEVVEAEQHFGDDRADLVLVEPALVHCTFNTCNCIGSQTLINDH